MANMTDTDLTDVIGAMVFPAAVIGHDARIVATNVQFDRVLGTAFQGRHFITALRHPAVIDAIEMTFKNGGVQTCPYVTQVDGREAGFDLHASKAGSRVLITLIDRTDADQTGRMRTDFIANVSHELRTPLTALTGFIETLQGAARHDPKAQNRFLGIMSQEAGRMTRLVDELMVLSRLEGSERVQPTQNVSLTHVVTTGLQALHPIAQAADMFIEVNLPTHPVTVQGDAAQLQQVLTNLVENALKYGGSGQRVVVTVTPHQMQSRLRTNGTTLTVQDFGDGIASHHIPRLTERFYRIDSHRSRNVGGTGLGLAIVKHILNRHRGRLDFDSVPGQGTTVTVTLPQSPQNLS